MTPGTLLLVPNALDLGADEVDLRDVLPDGVIRRAAALQHWAAEDARSTRAFLKRVAAVTPLAVALQAIAICELPRPRKGSREPVPATEWQALLAPALAGHDLGLISEAGLPAPKHGTATGYRYGCRCWACWCCCWCWCGCCWNSCGCYMNLSRA